MQYALYFDAWRWCFFLACFVPIYWVSRFITHMLVVIVEARVFSNAKLLYFMVSVRVRHFAPCPSTLHPVGGMHGI
jgi:hypothetical protein